MPGLAKRVFKATTLFCHYGQVNVTKFIQIFNTSQTIKTVRH